MVDIPGSGKNKIPSDYPGVKTYEKDLLECKWRDVSFPITDLETFIDHDLVEHKYPDREGAHVESMGRNPIKTTGKALFYNNVSKGKGETWKFGVMFPDVYNEFVVAIKDKSTGPLQHPFLGTFDAKVATTRTTLDANRRDGVAVEITWIETIKFETFNENNVTITPAVTAATELDDSLNTASQFPPDISSDLTTPKTSFLDLIDGVKALIDTATLIGMKALGAIDKVLYHINNLINSINRINSVLLSDLKSKCQALKDSMNALRKDVNQKLGEIRFFIVPRDSTIGEIASALGNNIVDLIKLNPTLAIKPIVPKLTPIKYYKLI